MQLQVVSGVCSLIVPYNGLISPDLPRAFQGQGSPGLKTTWGFPPFLLDLSTLLGGES